MRLGATEGRHLQEIDIHITATKPTKLSVGQNGWPFIFHFPGQGKTMQERTDALLWWHGAKKTKGCNRTSHLTLSPLIVAHDNFYFVNTRRLRFVSSCRRTGTGTRNWEVNRNNFKFTSTHYYVTPALCAGSVGILNCLSGLGKR